jgi:transposase
MAPARSVEKLFWDMYQHARGEDDTCSSNATIARLYQNFFKIKDSPVAKEFLSVKRMKNIVCERTTTAELQKIRKVRKNPIDEHELFIRAAIVKEPAIYLEELQEKLRLLCGNKFSVSVVCRALERYDLPRLRLNVKAAQQSERLFRECLARLKSYDPHLFLFLDETHVDNKSAMRTHGRGKKVQKRAGARRAQPSARQMFTTKRYTVLAAINLGGFILPACETVELEAGKGVDGARFLQWARDCLAPQLGNYVRGERNSVVVLDNASVHCAFFTELCKIIRERGAVIEFLSPYSPELNPIEKGFSKFKGELKKMQVDFSRDQLKTIRRALARITPSDVSGWYRFSGILPPVADAHSKRKADEDLIAAVAAGVVGVAAVHVLKRIRL